MRSSTEWSFARIVCKPRLSTLGRFGKMLSRGGPSRSLQISPAALPSSRHRLERASAPTLTFGEAPSQQLMRRSALRDQ